MAKHSGRRERRSNRQYGPENSGLVSRTARRVRSRVRSVATRVAARPIVQRVIVPTQRVFRRVREHRNMTKLAGIDLKSAVRDTALNAAGGATGAVISSVLTLNKDTKEWGVATHAVAQAAIGVAVKYFFGTSRAVGNFVAGMNGQAAGDALNKYGLQQAVKAIRALQ